MLANEMFDALLRAGLPGNQLKVALAIIRKTYGFNKKEDDLSASQIGEMCDIARPNASTAMNQLAARNIINKRPGRYGSIVSIQKDYSRWLPLPGKTGGTCMEVIHPCIDSIHVLDSDRGCLESIQFGCMESIHTKDNLPKDNLQKTESSAPRIDAMRGCPAGSLIDLYHELMPDNPRVKVLTTARSGTSMLHTRRRTGAKPASLPPAWCSRMARSRRAWLLRANDRPVHSAAATG